MTNLLVVENPAPIARSEWVNVATPTGFRRQLISLAASAKAMVSADDPTVTGIIGAHPISAATISDILVVIINNFICPLQLIETIEEYPCLIFHLRGRSSTSTFVVDLWLTSTPASAVVPMELLIVNSDPTTESIYSTASVMIVGLNGVQVNMWWGPWKGISGGLLLNTGFADTQAQAFAGFLSLTADELGMPWLYGPIMGMSVPAEWEDKWGPFGVVPKFAGYTEHDYAHEIAQWFLRMVTTQGQPWLPADLGLSPNAGSTGAQQDFGSTKLGPAFMRPGGGPLHALHAYQAALMETCRPGDFREADGSPVLPWLHQDHVTWSGYTHYHGGVSSDRLGKGPGIAMPWSGGWGGKDREHWSINNLCGAYLLTGSQLLLYLIEREARTFLSGETVDPRISTSHAGAPRGIGRTLHAAAWIDCCLKDGFLRDRFRARVEQRLVMINRETLFDGFALKPLGLINDPRAIPGIDCIAPWQEAQGIIGLRAAMLRFGGTIGDLASTILLRVCKTFVDYGWWNQNGTWMLADYHAWNDGNPLPPEAYPGPLVVRREGFEEWSWGAVMIANAVLDSERSRALLSVVPVPTKVADAEWIAVR